MLHATTDRRIARTRSALQHALLDLIGEQEYDAITVEAICARANVGRSTFYLHFASKDALKRAGLEHLGQDLLNEQRRAAEFADTAEPFSFGLAFFEHARRHIGVYRVLMRSSGRDAMLEGIRDILSQSIRAELISLRKAPADKTATELSVQFVAGAYLSVLGWWLERDARIAPEALHLIFRQLLEKGVVGAIQHT